MSPDKPKIALWFRYGPAEHTELFHAMPDIVESLARSCEVHYFGLQSSKPVPPVIAEKSVVNHLPFTVNRTSGADKIFKTMLWLLSIPWMAMKCRLMKVRVIYIDETVPLSAPLTRLFFGRNVAMTIADIFVDIYLSGNLVSRAVGRTIRALDMATWRRLPLIFTRAKSTRDYLATQGIAPERVHPVYDPCDFSIYHPADRRKAREAFGFTADDVVLVHHGILHPNKGNDRIIRAIAAVRPRLPNIRYLLIGDGPEMGRLKDLTKELGLEGTVRFTGWLPKLDQVNEALNAGDIGLVMRVGQQSDDFHMTGALIHAMAVGLPILAARLGGISEVIRDGENGFLFGPEDMALFQEQLIRLAGDASLRQNMGQRCLADARTLFDMAQVTEQTVQPLLALAGVER